MKYSESIIRKFILTSLLAMSIPLVASAEPQFNEGTGRNGSASFQGAMYPGHHFGHQGEAFHLPPEVALTESQRDQIFAIKHKQAALLYEQSKIVRKAHIDLRKLATSDQYDDEKAKAITEKVGKALVNIIFLRVQEKHQIYALLTAEQRNILSLRHADHAAGHPKFPHESEDEKHE